jgi:hypothetical protein
MYTTIELGRTAFAKLAKKMPQIRKQIGSHIAELPLKPEHGVQTAPSESGHFDLYEYDDVDLVPLAVSKGPL